ncbi:MAG: WG repeat-containing protein [Myxococcaceae bacterium]
MLPVLNEIEVSLCETHHVWQGAPLYSARFYRVLKYHSPGLSPVCDETGAFHINVLGEPVYGERFIKTFGFYCSHAAVEAEHGWGHITAQGHFLYPQKYDWCGNYQEGLCAVRDKDGNYFHIDQRGQRAYSESYAYVGDFKDRIAVVCTKEGKNSHINVEGKLTHHGQYQRLDVFHKGFARAKDERGWFHIMKDGHPAYSYRFADLEPFYNGQALAQTFKSGLVVINTSGEIMREVVS